LARLLINRWSVYRRKRCPTATKGKIGRY